jgi:hypothetical protein
MVSKFQAATACFSYSPPNFKLIILLPVVDAADLIVSKLSIKQSEIQKFKILPSV